MTINKTSEQGKLIVWMYWLFKIGFYLHAAMFVILLTSEHIRFVKQEGWQYTVRGYFPVQDETYGTYADHLVKKQTKGNVYFEIYQKGWARLD